MLFHAGAFMRLNELGLLPQKKLQTAMTITYSRILLFSIYPTSRDSCFVQLTCKPVCSGASQSLMPATTCSAASTNQMYESLRPSRPHPHFHLFSRRWC